MTSWQKLRDEAAQCARCDLYVRLAVPGRRALGHGRGSLVRLLAGARGGYHPPSAVLRGPDSEARDRAYAGLVADLAAAREAAAEAA